MSERVMSRRPLTASERDQELFAMVPEMGVLRRAERLGLNVYVGGGPGSGKTTLLRRVEHEYPGAAVFARAEPAGRPPNCSKRSRRQLCLPYLCGPGLREPNLM